MELPFEFQERMKNLLGEEYQAYLESFSKPAHNALRINTGKISVEEFREKTGWKLWPVPWIPNGFYYEDASNPAKHPHYYAGLYYLQEPSAMTPASRLPVKHGDRILDLCAAPGGKATELAARLEGTGMLLANDISHSRAKALLKNLEMQGVENMFVTSEDPEHLEKIYPEYFDAILLDAPCSGEGMFRKEKSMIGYWKEHGPEWYVPLQEKLIRQARRMLRPGGYLLYSTCTFSREENEGVIGAFLKEFPEMELYPVIPYEGFAPGISVDGQDLSACVHIFPHRMEGEGHFLALMRKRDEEGQAASYVSDCKEQRKETEGRHERKGGILPVQKNTEVSDAAREFLAHIKRNWSGGSFFRQKEQLYYLHEGMSPASGIRYLRTGLWVGTEKNGRFEPSQALAMALRPDEFDVVLDLSRADERILRYLRGETIFLREGELSGKKGWVLICEEGFPLGFGKITGASVKNKYYAGWRMV